MVPLKRDLEFDAVRSLARQIAEHIAAQDPKHRTIEALKTKRRGRVYIDTNRNAYGQTVAPAYAVRARAGAPVSVPISWSELKGKDLRPDAVTIHTVFNRLDKSHDPWKDLWKDAVSLTKATQRIEELHAA